MTRPGAPLNPRLILAISLIPGAGHVLLGLAQRGLIFLFFMIVLGWASMKLLSEHLTFFCRHIGGFLVYGFSILDAYRIARFREIKRSQNETDRD